MFCGWCRSRGVASVNATVPLVMDFLIHLRPDTGLFVSAVEGSSTALTSVLALKSWDLASSQEVNDASSLFLAMPGSFRVTSSCLGRFCGSSEPDRGSVGAFTDMRRVFSGSENSLLAGPCLG